jgi:hypothetical protein
MRFVRRGAEGGWREPECRTGTGDGSPIRLNYYECCWMIADVSPYDD